MSQSQRIPNKLKYLETLDLPTGSLKQLLAFDKQNQVDGISESRRMSYLISLPQLATATKKPFKENTKDDLIAYFSSLNELASETIKLYKINTKRFYKWLLVPNDDEYPDLVKWIKTKANGQGKEKKRKHAITPEQVQLLLQNTPSLKMQCLISFVYETACRIDSEALKLKLDDIQKDEYGFFVKIRQTKNRNESQVRLIDTAPALAQYMNTHRLKGKPNAFLFPADVGNDQLNYQTAEGALERVAKQAGIKEHISWHCLRHGRLTQLAKESWSDRELMAISGHKTHSMIGEYVKYRDVGKKQLVEAGIISAEGIKKDKTLEPIVCSVCHNQNTAGSEWCTCGRPLSQQAAQQQDRQKVDEIKAMINAALDEREKKP